MNTNQPGSSPQHQTSWIWIVVLIVIISGVAGFVYWYQANSSTLVAVSSLPDNAPHKVGGPCIYAEYPGTCQVTAVEEVSDQLIGGNSGSNIKFTFSLAKGETITQSGVELTPGQVYQKTLALNGTDGKIGSQACLDEFKIRKDKAYDCTLQVITSGTCTPQIFKFKEIDDKCLMY